MAKHKNAEKDLLEPTPHSRMAEQAVLACCLHDDTILDEVFGRVTLEHYYVATHQFIFQAMKDLRDNRIKIDLVTVSDRLKSLRLLVDVGYNYLVELYQDHYVSAHNINYHIGILEENYRQRQLVYLGKMLTMAMTTGKNSEALESDVRQVLENLHKSEKSKVMHIKEVLYASISNYDKGTDNKTFLKTGFLGLDERIIGFEPQMFYLVAARPSVGKTQAALHMMTTVARQTGVLFCSLEQPGVAIGDRLLCCTSGIPFAKYRQRALDEHERRCIINARNQLANLPIYMDDFSSPTVESMRALASKHVRMHGVGAMFVDYLQFVQSTDRFNNTNDQVATISRGFKAMARELNIPVIVLSQLNRGCETDNRRPMMRDLRDSGSLEQDADVIIFLHKARAFANETEYPLEVIIGKQRQGPVGLFSVYYEGSKLRYYDEHPKLFQPE